MFLFEWNDKMYITMIDIIIYILLSYLRILIFKIDSETLMNALNYVYLHTIFMYIYLRY